MTVSKFTYFGWRRFWISKFMGPFGPVTKPRLCGLISSVLTNFIDHVFRTLANINFISIWANAKPIQRLAWSSQPILLQHPVSSLNKMNLYNTLAWQPVNIPSYRQLLLSICCQFTQQLDWFWNSHARLSCLQVCFLSLMTWDLWVWSWFVLVVESQ